MDRALKFRQTLLQQKGCSFTCNLTADYGDVLYQFMLDCKTDSSGTVCFTVSAPDTLSGIQGEITGAGGKIRFEDQVLAFPLLSEELPTPLSAPWLFVAAIRSGYIRSCEVAENKMTLTVAQTYEDDSILLQIRFDKNEKPISCEIIWKNRRLLSMEVIAFQYL